MEIEPPNATISTGIELQLEITSLTVDEEVGFVEVCVNVTTDQECPIEFDAGFTLTSRSGTAGAVLYIQMIQSKAQ